MINKTGIDVSAHQGKIDWDEVKASGRVNFAIIRAGFGYKGIDAQFTRNVKECERVGMPYGVYWFSYMRYSGKKDTLLNENDSITRNRREVRSFMEAIKGTNPTCGVYLDIEEDAATISADGLLKASQDFKKIVENEGYKPGIYASKSLFVSKMNDKWYDDNTIKWVAQWGKEPTYKGEMDIWQFTSKGSIPGIEGNVDMDRTMLLIGPNKPEPEKPEKDPFMHERGYFKYGDRGDKIDKITKYMHAWYPLYAKKNVLGPVFGPNLLAAIKEFQKRTNLEPDGFIGPLTLAKMRELGFKY